MWGAAPVGGEVVSTGDGKAVGVGLGVAVGSDGHRCCRVRGRSLRTGGKNEHEAENEQARERTQFMLHLFTSPNTITHEIILYG